MSDQTKPNIDAHLNLKPKEAAEVPAGYMRNAQGHLVPIETVREIDKLRDQTVLAIVKKAKDVQQILRGFRTMVESDIDEFVATSLEQHGVKTGGAKGHVTLMSFCGRYKVIRAMHDQVVFDEQLIAAKVLVDECMSDWTSGAVAELRTLVNEAFKVNETGSVRHSEILRLLRYDINDERWKRAMDAIRAAIQITGSKAYFRVYERIGDTDNYQAISLDIAKV